MHHARFSARKNLSGFSREGALTAEGGKFNVTRTFYKKTKLFENLEGKHEHSILEFTYAISR